jgi:hypothetical protein
MFPVHQLPEDRFMRAILFFIAVLTCGSAVLVRSDPVAPPVTEAPRDETPRQMLRRASKVYDLLDVDAALALYLADGDKERELVKLFAKYGVEMAKAEHAVEKKFGRAAADDLLHAAGDMTDADVDDAKVEVDDDKATVTFKGEETPLFLKRVEGAWKMDVGRIFKDFGDDEIAAYKAQMERCADGLPTLTKAVEAGDHASAEPVIAAVKKLAEPPPAPAPGKGGL